MKFSYNSIGKPVALLYNKVKYSYNVWGNIRSVFGRMASTFGQDNPIRYRGYYYDTEIKLFSAMFVKLRGGFREYGNENENYVDESFFSILHSL